MLILCHYLEKLSRFEEKRLGSDIVVMRKKRRCKVAGGFKLTICPKSIIDYRRRDLGKGIDRYLGVFEFFRHRCGRKPGNDTQILRRVVRNKGEGLYRVLMQNERNVLSRTR